MANNVKDQANEISEPKKYVKLLHDYRAVTEDEINGVKDEVFELLSDEDEVWKESGGHVVVHDAEGMLHILQNGDRPRFPYIKDAK